MESSRLAVLILLTPMLAIAQLPIWSQLEPPVIVPGSTSTLLVQVRVTGSPTRVTFESALQPGIEVDMKDDGTGGDRAAGDGIYTITLPAAPIVAAMRPDDVYRPLLGYYRAYSGTTSNGRYNVLAEVADPAIPRLPVVADAPDVQHTDYVVNILSPQAFPSNSAPSTIPGQATVTKRFFALFPDVFDVINVVYVPSFFQNRFHYQVRNAVHGIGTSTSDSGASYGSPSHLLGVSVFPISTFFDGADTGVQHELGHQWINFLNVPPVAQGIPHWPLSTMASGTMGYSLVGAEGGMFPCLIVSDSNGVRLVPNPNQPVFADMDLYLMGLLPADQVGEQIVLANQDATSVMAQCNGSVYSGAFTRLHLSDLSGNPSIGPRVPDAASSPKQFRLATIVVTRDSLLSPEAMAFYSLFAERMEGQTAVPIHQGLLTATGYPFAVSTRGLGALAAQITASSPPNLAVSATSLQFAYTLGGALPAGLPVQIANAGGGTLSWTASSSVPWLSATPASGAASSTLTIAINASATSLAAGTFTGYVTVAGQGALAQRISVTLNVSGPPLPQVNSGGVVNNASYNLVSSSVAPGSIAALFGTNLTNGTTCLPPACNPLFTNGRLGSTMAGAQVTVNGTAVPVFYAASGQLGIQIPFEATGTSATVSVSVAGQASTPATITLAPVSPGIFTATADGKGAGAVSHVDGTAVSTQNPAHANEVVILYATGLGQVAPAVPTGALPTGASSTVQPVTLSIGGINVIPDFAGLAGCCVGLNQINVRLPAGVGSGNAVPVVLSIGGRSSNTASIAVQ